MTPRNSTIRSDDPRERQLDALDAANDERKERALEHNRRQAIPVIAQRSIDLFALWDAALIAKASTVYIHESHEPGAAAALRAWAASRGFVTEDTIYPEHDGPGAYASLSVEPRWACSFCVLRYRDATDDEIARATSAEAAGKVQP